MAWRGGAGLGAVREGRRGEGEAPTAHLVGLTGGVSLVSLIIDSR